MGKRSTPDSLAQKLSLLSRQHTLGRFFLMFNAETQRRGDAEKLENLITDQIINAAIEVHRILGGPGLLESLYEEALYHELQLRHIPVEVQVLAASPSALSCDLRRVLPSIAITCAGRRSATSSVHFTKRFSNSSGSIMRKTLSNVS